LIAFGFKKLLLMDYSRYQVEDFVTDEYFIRWVKSPNEESNSFWNAWLSKNPAHRLRIHEARQIILLLDIKEDKPAEGRFLEIWENITREDQNYPEPHTDEKLPRASMKWYYKLAASLLFLTLIGAALLVYNRRTVTISTAYGEARTLFLPDSTKVTLNSNSSLRFSRINFNEKGREVWLDGEAFFAVVRKNNQQNFLVHTDQLEVEVLGTKFDVNSRRGKTRVILEEGKVKLDLKSPSNKPVIMKPGELVEYSEKDKAPTRKTVDPTNYLSWKNNRLVFTSTSLLEIAHLLEDNYGYNVVFEDQEISKRRFTGSTSSENVKELFQKLSLVFALSVQQDSNRIIIRYNKEKPRQPSSP
jgi:ferric-dicitrate binding protein FerR (iron transport regulator)